MHGALIATLDAGLEGAALVAATMLGSYVAIWAAHHLTGILVNRKIK